MTEVTTSRERVYPCSADNNMSWECSGSVVECLSRYRGVAGSSLTAVTRLCPLARHINPCLVVVQPRKTRPDIGRDVKNQIK